MRANVMCGPGPAGPFVPSPSGTFSRSVGSLAVAPVPAPTPAAPGAPRRRSPRVTDVRRRRLVGALVLAAVIAVAVAVAMLAGSGAEPAAAAGVVPAVADASTSAAASGEPAGTAPAVHVARAGDTMWAIAHRYRGSTPHGDYLAALLERNGGAALRVGQPVALP